MASAAVLWFGEIMSAVPLRNNKAVAAAARTVTVLGATGSIGDSTMDLLRGARDRYSVEALTANTNVEALAKLAREFGARFAAIADPARLAELKDALAGTGIECGAGESAIIEAAARPADWVMAAVSGAAGLKPALAAVDRGATVALANKECLVCAGDFFMQRAVTAKACILPADSEHNALHQCLRGEKQAEVFIKGAGNSTIEWAGMSWAKRRKDLNPLGPDPKTAAEIVKVQDKLANPNFVQKVPPHVLNEHQKRLTDWQRRHQHLEKSLRDLGGA